MDGFVSECRMRFHAVLLGLFVVLGSSLALAGEMDERRAIELGIMQRFLNRDFAALEVESASYLDLSQRTPSGLPKLTHFNSAFDALFDTRHRDPEFWKPLDEIASEWIRQYPKSGAARIVYAQLLFNRGWSYRGSGYASSVAKKDWTPYFEHIERARSYLVTHADVAAASPLYDDMMLLIANAQQIPDASFNAMAKAALGRHPGYYQMYFTIINHLVPKWGGDVHSVEKFAREALALTKAEEGYGMYARIYWAASQYQFGNALFAVSNVSWADMKRGIADVLKKYPDDWNINNFARFACLAKDKALAKELTARITSKWIPEAWTGNLSFAECKAWAETG